MQLVCIVTPRCCYDDSENLHRCNVLLNLLGCGAWNVTRASCDKILISGGIPTWSMSADLE
jgi:hypothetical protein